MSIHANQSTKGGPSSSRAKIRGAGATYRASVQKQSRTRSSTTGAKMGSDNAKTVGQGSDPVMNTPTASAPVYGTGHYTPNRG